VGLAGTGSKDVAITKLYVPDYRTISAWAMNGKPHAGSAVNPGPLWKLPMLALGPYVLSGVMLGCAQGAYEQVVGAARQRNATSTGRPVGLSQAIQIKVAEASVRIDTAELLMRQVCEHAMAVARSAQEVRHEDKLRYRRDAFFSVRLSFEAVNILMNVSGSSGLYLKNSVQRLFRDAHACNAHVMFSTDVQAPLFGAHALGMSGPPPLM
jgi:3-hydroxy-9,10-secoandrosta-1,3,5(10)-triene-9,17-dione monooxygenase